MSGKFKSVSRALDMRQAVHFNPFFDPLRSTKVVHGHLLQAILITTPHDLMSSLNERMSISTLLTMPFASFLQGRHNHLRRSKG